MRSSFRLMPICKGTGSRRRNDRATAWGCVVTNLLTLPGLGSLAAGRKVGYFQIALAGVGFAGTVLSLGLVFWDWVRTGHRPQEVTPSLKGGLVAIGLFAVAWLWALATSVTILREARKKRGDSPPPPLVPPRLDG